ncbi:MAG: enoyl-CoA hydratase [Candidatus Methanolliviera hydrocarbonicum]|uniref:Enoyl-CoA hydratase domain-containing protein 3, mitochondrial n=1 Tax=Candidatus Methanolliviera hydrocarbonicum TaxID=2491085 RepID=A0A520KXX7_9EURY|nr:MAG: enoyl-CoA hydratase [Candidatus Methanolliviera hydrocarbonicum]
MIKMEYKNLIMERKEHVGIITMNRPYTLNALNSDLMSEMLTAFEELEGDERIGAIVLKGAGKSFCTGHDLKELATLSPLDRRDVFGRSVKIWEYIARMTKPVIAAVHGYATAAGCGMAAACDLVIASEDAKFQTPGVDIGVFCITPMVPLSRSVGMKRSVEMLFTGDIISAKEAEKIGLVNKVVPNDKLIDSALELAKRISEKSWAALHIGKPAFYSIFDMDYIHALEYARDLITLASTSEETVEGITAILEKRAPRWKH